MKTREPIRLTRINSGEYEWNGFTISRHSHAPNTWLIRDGTRREWSYECCSFKHAREWLNRVYVEFRQ